MFTGTAWNVSKVNEHIAPIEMKFDMEGLAVPHQILPLSVQGFDLVSRKLNFMYYAVKEDVKRFCLSWEDAQDWNTWRRKLMA